MRVFLMVVVAWVVAVTVVLYAEDWGGVVAEAVHWVGL